MSRIAEALSEGYSYAEIAAFLGNDKRVADARAEGYSDEDIVNFLQANESALDREAQEEKDAPVISGLLSKAKPSMLGEYLNQEIPESPRVIPTYTDRLKNSEAEVRRVPNAPMSETNSFADASRQTIKAQNSVKDTVIEDNAIALKSLPDVKPEEKDLFLRGLGGATGQMIAGTVGFVGQAMDATGFGTPESVAKVYKNLKDRADSLSPKAISEMSEMDQAAYYLGSGLATSAGSILAIAQPQLALPYLGFMGTTTSGNKYQDLIKRGVEKPEAQANALITGTAEALTEMLGIKGGQRVMQFYSKLPLEARRQLTKRLLLGTGIIALGAGEEGYEELVNKQVGNVTDILTGVFMQSTERGDQKTAGKLADTRVAEGSGEAFKGGAYGGLLFGAGGAVMADSQAVKPNNIAELRQDIQTQWGEQISGATVTGGPTAEQLLHPDRAQYTVVPPAPTSSPTNMDMGNQLLQMERDAPSATVADVMAPEATVDESIAAAQSMIDKPIADLDIDAVIESVTQPTEVADGGTDQGGQVPALAAEGYQGAGLNVPGSGGYSQTGLLGGLAGGSGSAAVPSATDGSVVPAGNAGVQGVTTPEIPTKSPFDLSYIKDQTNKRIEELGLPIDKLNRNSDAEYDEDMRIARETAAIGTTPATPLPESGANQSVTQAEPASLPVESAAKTEPWQKTRAEYDAPSVLKAQESFYTDIGPNKVEVMRNPSPQDLSAMRSEAKKEFPNDTSGDPVIRFTEDADGNKYYWKAHLGVHQQVEPIIAKREGVPVDQNAAGKLSHRGVVRKALYDGEQVPANVLGEYPGLVAEVQSIPGNKYTGEQVAPEFTEPITQEGQTQSPQVASEGATHLGQGIALAREGVVAAEESADQVRKVISNTKTGYENGKEFVEFDYAGNDTHKFPAGHYKLPVEGVAAKWLENKGYMLGSSEELDTGVAAKLLFQQGVKAAPTKALAAPTVTPAQQKVVDDVNASLVAEREKLGDKAPPLQQLTVATPEQMTPAVRDELPMVLNVLRTMGYKGDVVVAASGNNTPMNFDGVVSSNGAGIIIAADSVRPVSYVLGHEFPHEIEKEAPAVYKTLADVILSNSSEDKMVAHLQRRGYLDAKATAKDVTMPMRAEFVNDTFADMINNPKQGPLILLETAKNMDAVEPGSGKDFLTRLNDFIKRVIKGLVGKGYGTEAAINKSELGAIRKAIAKALTDYNLQAKKAEKAKVAESKKAALAAEVERAKAKPADTQVTVDYGGGKLSIDLGKPAYTATPGDVEKAVRAAGFSAEQRPGSKYDPMAMWHAAHTKILVDAAAKGLPIPSETLYERTGLIRDDLSDDQRDLAADEMVSVFKQTKSYDAAVQAYRDFGKVTPPTDTKTDEVSDADGAKTDAAPVEYRYAMFNRPAGLGTIPKEGFIRSEPRPEKGEAHYDYARNGIAVFNRKLTDAETKNFEMSPMLEQTDLDELATAVVGKMQKYADGYREMAEEEPEQFARTVSDKVNDVAGGYRPSIADMDAFVAQVKASLAGENTDAAPATDTQTTDMVEVIEEQDDFEQDVVDQLARFEAGDFSLPGNISYNLTGTAEEKQAAKEAAKAANETRTKVYVEAAKRFLEGDMTAKKPGKRDSKLSIDDVEGATPKSVVRNVKKVKTLDDTIKALHNIAGDGDIRYYLNGVHVEGDTLVATDGHRAAVIADVDTTGLPYKTKADEGLTILNRYYGKKKSASGSPAPDKAWVDGIFPDWKRVVPERHASLHYMDAVQVGGYARGVAVAIGYAGPYNVAVPITIGDTTRTFNPQYIADAMELFRAFGYDTIEASFPSTGTIDGSIYLTSPDGKVRQVVMSTRGNPDTFSPIIAAQEESGPKGPKRSNRTTNDQQTEAGKANTGAPDTGAIGAEPATRDRQDSYLQVYAEGTITIDGQERPTTNSNGKPIAQTEEGLRNFWKWFGDSAVVDADGRPLVVYHGTGKQYGNRGEVISGDFDTFDAGLSGMASKTGAPEGTFFFSNDPEVASSYTVSWRGDFSETYRDNANVMPVYLKIEKPAKVNAKGENWREVLYKGEYSDVNEIAAIVQEAGKNDGVVVAKVKDHGVGKTSGKPSNTYIAFDPTQIKSAIGNDGGFDGTNPDIRRSRRAPLQHQGVPKTWGNGGTVTTPMDSVIYTLQDKHIELKRAVQEIKATGIHLDDQWDPYLTEELFHGRAATRAKAFIDDELHPLTKDLLAAGIKIEDFDDFLWARHAVNRNEEMEKINPGQVDANGDRNGSGLTDAEAQAKLAALTPARRAEMDTFAARVDAINAETRRLMVEYGLETQETIDLWEQMYPTYVPLMRDIEEDGGIGSGAGFSTGGKTSKRAMGSDRPVENILGNIANQRDKVITKGEKNRVSLAVYGAALLSPNPDFWGAINPLKVNANTPASIVAIEKAKLRRELTAMGLPAATISNMVERPAEKTIHPITGMVVYQVNPLFMQADNILSLRVNGQDRFVVFNKTNEKAVRTVASLKNLNVADAVYNNKGVENTMHAVAATTRYFSKINTQYNPIFGAVNLVRDVQGALLNLESTELKGQQKEILKDVARLLKDAARHGFRMEKLDPADLVWWKEMLREGGTTGYRDLFKSGKERNDAIVNALDPKNWQKTKWGKVLTANGYLASTEQLLLDKAAKPVVDWLSDYNETMENVVRLAVYMAARDHGLSEAKAASISKNITTNFNRRGDIGQQAGMVYAFFNAAVQGTARIGENLLDRKADGKYVISKAGKAIVGGGLLVGMLQPLMLALAGYGDDEPPEFVRDRNMIIPLGPKSLGMGYATIPMPLGYHVIPGMARIPMEALMSDKDVKPKDVVWKMLGMFVEAFNPLGGSGSLALMVSPTITDPMLSLALNEDWNGRPIYQESFSNLNESPGHMRAKDNSTELGYAVSYGINLLSGGSKYQAGEWSPTPDAVEYMVGQLTGGVGREVMKAWKMGKNIATGEAVPAHQIPLASRFYGRVDGKSGEGSKFYENLKYFSELRREKLDREDAKDNVAKFKEDNPDYKLIDSVMLARTEVNRLRKKKDELKEKGASRERIRLIDDKITGRMARINKKIEERRAARED